MIENANARNNSMNDKQILWILPKESGLPEIIMQRNNDSSCEEACYEIIADENGKIRKIYGEFGHDARSASRTLLKTLLRLDISLEKALTAAKKFYLSTKIFSTLPQIHDSGKNCSSNS